MEAEITNDLSASFLSFESKATSGGYWEKKVQCHPCLGYRKWRATFKPKYDVISAVFFFQSLQFHFFQNYSKFVNTESILHKTA